MTLKTPFLITSRLLPGVQISGAFISIEDVGCNREGRTCYRWHIDFPTGSTFTGNDLKSGCQGGTLQEGMASLLSFLSAAAESYPDGENADLFPTAVTEWAYQNSDEISLLGIEIEEATEPLIS